MNKKVILLVEDNPDHELLTIRALRQHGLAGDIVVARDGVEALEYLFGDGARNGEAGHGLPHVILLDLKLPRIDGLEVLHQVRSHRRTRRLPVVVLTSSDDEKDMADSYDRGANSYIRKPVDFREFSRITRQLGEYWLNLNQAPPMVGGM
ncbi:MAG: response regulator [Firmicutes bacterium]|nr:response regulator [Bacillota bacterium]